MNTVSEQHKWPSSCLVQFKNCTILRNHELIVEDLWVRNNVIVNPEPIFFDERVTADIQLDCNGAIIAPGYIDLQINGGMGVDFSHSVDTIVEAVQKVAKGVLPFGVTSMCPTIVTSTPDVYRKALTAVKKHNGSAEGAGILGVHLEGPFISKHKKGAHKAQLIQDLSGGFESLMHVYGSLDSVAIVTMAPELDPDGKVIQALVKKGVTVSIGHSEANLVQGEKAMQDGASFITHLFNAMLPFHHRDPGLVGLLTSKKLPEEKNVFYGIIADGIHTHPAALRIAYKANSRGLTLVTDAMSAMGLEAGVHYIGENKVEILGKRAVIAGTTTLCGSIATMDFCVRYLQKSTGCTSVEALESASLHAAEVLGIQKRKGTLDFGADADFVVLDSNLHVLSTWIAGECVWMKPGVQLTVIYAKPNLISRS
ncbi:N-acetylglucosamine-6-phosphate deacetylase [Rhipicephalus microplus]|uniref:N-acetylglucosamine-6-phosphate deacetylase n=1 Tax=Rhipicephalus microplus TaxID=6941 RepID=UPI003F6C68C6